MALTKKMVLDQYQWMLDDYRFKDRHVNLDELWEFSNACAKEHKTPTFYVTQQITVVPNKENRRSISRIFRVALISSLGLIDTSISTVKSNQPTPDKAIIDLMDIACLEFTHNDETCKYCFGDRIETRFNITMQNGLYVVDSIPVTFPETYKCLKYYTYFYNPTPFEEKIERFFDEKNPLGTIGFTFRYYPKAKPNDMMSIEMDIYYR